MRDKLTSEETRNHLLSAYELCFRSDVITGLELVYRRQMSPEQLREYITKYAGPTSLLEGGPSMLDRMKRLLGRGCSLSEESLNLFPKRFLVTAKDIGFDISDFLQKGLAEKGQLPTAHDLEVTLYEESIVKNHRPEASDWMTFALFFDGYNPGHEDWHYGFVVGLDEHITSTEGEIDGALNLNVLVSSFSRELFPNEEKVAEFLENNQLAGYPDSPILEMKSHLAATFAQYHIIAERVRKRKREINPNHPLNLL